MANILPRKKPGVTVEQTIAASTTTPSTPTQPTVVVGVMNQIVKDSKLTSNYVGEALKFVLPDIESAAVVDITKSSVVLSNIKVGILGYGDIDPIAVSVTSVPGLDYLVATGVPSGVEVFAGVRSGDLVEVEQSVTNGSSGTVLNISPSLIKAPLNSFNSVLPGDSISVNSVVRTVLAVDNSGSSAQIIADGNLPVGTGLNYFINRKLNAVVEAIPTGNQLKISKEGISDSTSTVKVARILTAGGNYDQPLSTGSLVLSNPDDFIQSETAFENDSFTIEASKQISGFSAFNSYPVKFLTGSGDFTVNGGTLTKLEGPTGLNGSKFTTELAPQDVIEITYNTDTLFDSGTTVFNVSIGGSTLSVSAGSANPNTLFSASDIVVLDAGTPNEESFTVVSTTSTTIVVSSPATLAHTGAQAVERVVSTIYREVDTITDDSNLFVTSAFPAAFTNGISKGPDKDKPIIDSSVVVSYIARRTKDANKILTINNGTELEGIVGPISVENPLGLAVSLAIGNSAGQQVFAMPIQDETNSSWLEAIGILESKDLYHIVPLSQSSTIQGFFKSHVDGMSSSTYGAWRVLFANLAQPTESVSVIQLGGSLKVATVAGTPPTGSIYLSDSKVNLSNLVNVGDYIKVMSQTGVVNTIPSSNSSSFVDPSTSATVYYRIYKVLQKINSSKVRLELISYSGSDGVYAQNAASSVASESSTFTARYEIIKLLTKDEEAQIIGQTAKSFNDRRVNYITNNSCVVEIDGVDYEVEGFYLGAAIAGLSSGTLPHQPLTNFPIVGIKGVRGGSEYFNITQQGIIAGGGGWLVVQDVLDTSLPYTWQQLTTSQGGVKEQEFSFTKNLDEISKAIKIDHVRFPGVNNLVTETINAIEAQTTASLETRTINRKQSPLGGFLGSQIVSYTINGVIEDPLLPGVCYVDVVLVLPITLNFLIFRLLA